MARRWDEATAQLHPDSSGVIWDLVLYVPTVGFLLLWGVKMWYVGDDNMWVGYTLMFLGFLFLMNGGSRILKRLLILPSAPVSIDVNGERIRMKLKGGDYVALLRDVRFFTDSNLAQKSFALTGLDNNGTKRQFVFHRKQFDEQEFQQVVKALDRYK